MVQQLHHLQKMGDQTEIFPPVTTCHAGDGVYRLLRPPYTADPLPMLPGTRLCSWFRQRTPESAGLWPGNSPATASFVGSVPVDFQVPRLQNIAQPTPLYTLYPLQASKHPQNRRIEKPQFQLKMFKRIINPNLQFRT